MKRNPSKSQPNPYELRYVAAEIARRDGIRIPNYKDGEDAIKRDRDLMVRINRDLYANNPCYRAIINGLVSVTIGEDGVEFAPATDNPTIKETLRNAFLAWAKVADVSGRYPFTEIERTILRELLIVGEVLIVKRKSNLTVQVVESERIKEIVTDSDGRTLSVKVKDSTTDTGEIEIQAADCIYISMSDRPSQIRGTGILWSCCDILQMILFVLRRSGAAWQLSSSYAVAVERQNLENANPFSENQTTNTDDTQATPAVIDVDGVQMFLGGQGDKLSVINHNGIPNSQLAEHVLTYLRVVSSTCGIDAASFVLADYSQLNYSSSRSATIALTRTIKALQNKLSYCFYTRILKWLLGSWMSKGDYGLSNDASLLDTIEFQFPRIVSVDEKGESEAARNLLQLGLATHSQLLQQRNIDPAQYAIQRKQEIIDAIQTAKEIKEQTGAEVPWQSLCGMAQ